MASPQTVHNPQAQAGSGSLSSDRYLVIGVTLILCGLAVLMIPAIWTSGVSLVAGGALAVAGIVRTTQAFQIEKPATRMWYMLAGVVEVIGGILVYVHTMKGSIAFTVLLALVLIAQGGAHAGQALKMRSQPGWQWLLAAGLLAILVSAALILKLQWFRSFPPSSVAAIAFLAAGVAYVAISYLSSQSRKTP
jgi:uncharacterized membrane protein HdeD (DUF308 family)